MAATKRAMTSLPASPQSLFLPSAEEPEDNRINFRDSLKFFQEQLVLNGTNFPSPVSRSGSDTLRKNGHRSYKEQTPDKKEKVPKENEAFESDIQSIKSCKIAIPTVDTILESVRVLRAIQKSQEERGSSWNLDVTSKPDIDFNYTDDWEQATDVNQSKSSDKNLSDEIKKEIQSINYVDKQTITKAKQNYYSDEESINEKTDVTLSNTVDKEIVTDINQNDCCDKNADNERNVETTVITSVNNHIVKSTYQNDYSDTQYITEEKLNKTTEKDHILRQSIELKFETQIDVIEESLTQSNNKSLSMHSSNNNVNEICSFWPSNILQNENHWNELISSSEAENKNAKSEILKINEENLRNSSSANIDTFQMNGESFDIKLSDKENLQETIQQKNACNTDVIAHTNNFEKSQTKNNQICDTPNTLRAACTDLLNHLNETSNNKEKSKELLLKRSETTTEILKIETTTQILKIETYEDVETQKHSFLLNETLWKESCSTSDNTSTKVELNDSDSGIGTQRSASSLSPNNPNHMQKDSWSDTCSSQYASAECSPYHSLNSVFESSLGLNNTAGETKEHENSAISTPLTGSEWEDALDKTQKSTEESSEDDPLSVPQQCDAKNCYNLEDLLTNSSTQLNDFESHSENVERDTEISYCNFITNSTIEKPCETIEEKFEEAVSEICDIKTQELKPVSGQETNICKNIIHTNIENIEHTVNTLIEKNIEDSEQTVDAVIQNSIEVSEETVGTVIQETVETSKQMVNAVIQNSIVVSEQTVGTITQANIENHEETVDTVMQNGIGVSEQTVGAVIQTNIEDPDQTVDAITQEIVETSEQIFNSEQEVCEQIVKEEKNYSEHVIVLQNAESLTSLDLQQNNAVEDDSCDLGRIQKFTAASCDLISLVGSLYAIKENPAYQVLQTEDATEEKFEETLFVLSKGAFCEHPEENYLVIIENSVLQITKDSHVLLSLKMKYGEITLENDCVKIDNRMGRCIYVKCDFVNMLSLKAKIDLHSLKHWQTDCLQLVHYPLKCHQNVVIIDIGSCSTRAGILMDQPTLPSLFFPTICATDKRTGTSLYGMEALQPEVRQHSNLSFPVRPTNKITKHTIDIDLMEGLFKKIFYDLKVDPTQYSVQVCLPRNLSIPSQTALVKLLLEDLKAKAVSLTNQALLTLYAHDVSTAVVVDIGDRTDVLPVVDGFIVENGVTRLPHGGQRLIHHMKHGLAEKRISLSNEIDSFVVQYIIENLAYVADDYDNEMRIAAQYPNIVAKTVTLQPALSESLHSKSITLEEARYKIPEGLFNPDLWGLDSPGIHHLVQKAIQATGVDARKRIAENIYVSGGVTMLPGFVERLQKEVTKLSKAKIVPKIHASNYRYHCTYIGACKFAKMEVFPQVCINLQEYMENSASALKKCALYF